MNRSRYPVIIVLILALLATGATQYWSRAVHDRAVGRIPGGSSAGASTSLSGMDSFALALLLGGLRGPLVMFLWMTSETQKNEKNLEDFDTRVEWIRLLQPEFDTVHIFQIWNKAYNISVQMASLSNKYTTILDAIEYAKNVARQRPNNINIIASIGGIYFDKLGNSSEKQYYINRVRRETLPHKQAPQSLKRSDPSWRPLQMDVMLDAQGNLAGPASDFEYLKKYEPFPYGLSPLAIAYDYYKQAQYLQNVKKQTHIQLSDLVIDSRPALALKGWSEEEWERARRRELALFGRPVPEERIDMELPTADVSLNQPFAKDLTPEQTEQAADEALFSYARAARLAVDAREEYRQHLLRFDTNRSTYLSHLDHLAAVEQLIRGDHDYLAALRAAHAGDADQRRALAASAAEHYRQAIPLNQRIILKYYTDDVVANAVGYDRTEVDKIPDERLGGLLARAQQVVASRGPRYDNYREDRSEYEHYIQRAQTRLKNLPAASSAPATSSAQPSSLDLAFASSR